MLQILPQSFWWAFWVGCLVLLAVALDVAFFYGAAAFSFCGFIQAILGEIIDEELKK